MPYLPTWEAARPFFPDRQAWLAAMERLFPGGDPNALKNRHYARAQPLSAEEWQALESLYAGELRLTDALTRAIVESVEAHADPERTLVFLVSDHGENFGDHGHIVHVFNLYESNVRIALLARGPGFPRGAREPRLVQIQDLYPTVLRAAGLAVEPDCAGLDLRGPLPDARRLALSLDFPAQPLAAFPASLRASGALDVYARSLAAGVDARFKLIRGSDGSFERYDLRADPNEAAAVAPADLETPEWQRLAAFVGAPGGGPAPPGGEPDAALRDPELREALRSLGYVQ
jgi:arylsulfatase A-like enzyme